MLMAAIIKSAHVPKYKRGLDRWEQLNSDEQKDLYDSMLHDLQTMIKASEMLESHTRKALGSLTEYQENIMY